MFISVNIDVPTSFCNSDESIKLEATTFKSNGNLL